MNKQKSENYAVLRGPLESGRQSPNSIAGILLLSIFMQGLLVFLEYFVSDYTIFPNKEQIVKVHLWVTGVLIVFAVIYSIPAVYMRSQRIQYLLMILISQNVGFVSFYFLVLFYIGTPESGITVNEESLLALSNYTLIISALIFMVTFVRFYILLRKGHYRRGSKKDVLRNKFETKSYLPMVIVGSTGLVFILQYIVRHASGFNLDMIFLIAFPYIICFTMIFVLPEQLVILYCKFRFKSFNFGRKGRLQSGR